MYDGSDTKMYLEEIGWGIIYIDENAFCGHLKYIEHQPFQDIGYIFLKMIKPDLYKVQFQEIIRQSIESLYNIIHYYFVLNLWQKWGLNLYSFLQRIIYSLLNPNGCAKLIC